MEPAISGLKSELSASVQVQRTAIALEAQRREEALSVLEKQLERQREEAEGLRKRGKEMMSDLEEKEVVLQAGSRRVGWLKRRAEGLTGLPGV